jgi:hypothetical protein
MTHWFKQKRYGFGASPSSWQGWALTAAYVAVLLGLSAWLTDGANANESRTLVFLGLTAVVTILFLGIVWRTTEGGWRWRWGDEEKR